MCAAARNSLVTLPLVLNPMTNATTCGVIGRVTSTTRAFLKDLAVGPSTSLRHWSRHSVGITLLSTQNTLAYFSQSLGTAHSSDFARATHQQQHISGHDAFSGVPLWKQTNQFKKTGQTMAVRILLAISTPRMATSSPWSARIITAAK